jgi:hypothetical protein
MSSQCRLNSWLCGEYRVVSVSVTVQVDVRHDVLIAPPWRTEGFGYSVKLKIEFAILNQLRDSVKQTSNSSGYGPGLSDGEGFSLSNRGNKKANSKARVSALERQTFDELEDHAQIHVTKTTQISVEHNDIKNPVATEAPRIRGLPGHPPSESSSEVEFATKGV